MTDELYEGSFVFVTRFTGPARKGNRRRFKVDIFDSVDFDNRHNLSEELRAAAEVIERDMEYQDILIGSMK